VKYRKIPQTWHNNPMRKKHNAVCHCG